MAFPLRDYLLRITDDPQHRSTYVHFLYGADLIDNVTLWGWLSDELGPLPACIVADTYESLGFRPFAGYPLTKAIA